MTEAKVYNTEGKEVGTYKLPESIFALPWNGDLVHQVVVAMEGNARTPVAHTKGRGEVRGGGKKPWRQKGTGRAGHGSSRSPIWKGGGVSHGPRKDRDYMEKINKKAKRKAVLAILSQKLKDGEIFFMDDLSLPEAKTKNAREILGNMPLGNSSALVILPRKDAPTWRALRNLKNVSIKEARNL